MIISFHDLIVDKSIDIKVNPEQKIADTLLILQENGFLCKSNNVTDRKVRSYRQADFVDTDKTYKQEKIYYGDILAIYE